MVASTADAAPILAVRRTAKRQLELIPSNVDFGNRQVGNTIQQVIQ